MKTIICALLSLSFIGSAIGQRDLEINENNITFHMNPEGAFFFQQDKSKASFKMDSINNCFGANVWITATNNVGDEMLTLEHFAKTELTSGPYASNYEDSTYVNECTNKVWFVTKQQIMNHKADYSNAGYVVPENIANWPSEQCDIGSYEDVNKNEIYDPVNGDYPIIPGDFATLTVRNDLNPKVHRDTPLGSLDLQIIQLTFGYIGLGSPFDETIFTRFIISNYSSSTWYNPLFAIFHDFDIGNFSDDAFGTLPDLHAVFTYNGDAVDDVSSGSAAGYGNHPPALAITFLNTNLVASMLEYPTGTIPDPRSKSIQQMKGFLWDGTESETFPFIFPGLPSDPNSGAERNVGSHPGDRRGTCTTQLPNLLPGQSTTIDAAWVWSRDTTQAYPESVDKVYDDVKTVREFYNTSVNVAFLTPLTSNAILYPNPTSDIVTISSAAEAWSVYSLEGKQLMKGNSQVVDLSHLTDGIYLIRIEDKNGLLTVNRVVKH